MNLTSGMFTAPRSGSYFFSFAGISGGNFLGVGLFVNESKIGSGHGKPDTDFVTISLQSTLHLNAGDKCARTGTSPSGRRFFFWMGVELRS